MRKLLYIILFLPVLALGQTDTVATIPINEEPADLFTAGLGFGQDLGGIGANLIYYPTKNLGFQGGLGYALAGVGYNVGLKYRFLKGESLSKRTFYLMGLYGYNAAIKVKDSPSLSKVFIGPSFGLGFDSKALGSSHTYWSFAVLYPIRGDDVQKYIDEKNIKLNNDLYPITLSISYKMIIH